MEGFEKGDICNRNGCHGIIEQRDLDGCCSCHINPPCNYCTTPKEYCDECGWDAEYEDSEPTPFMVLYPKKEDEKIYSWKYYPTPPRYIGDDLKPIWNVNQYFDEIFEKRISIMLTKEQAEKLVSTFRRSIYTKWDISKGDNKY